MTAAVRESNPVHEANRRSWNAATVAHNTHKGDQAAFLRSGGSTLFDEELGLLGPLAGVRVAHLMCNCGQDSLSLAAAGAVVTGIDTSDEAIACAAGLSTRAGIDAEFERADVYDWLERAASEGRTFDVVFCSYGALIWLTDLHVWARGVAAVLAPGGRLVCVEFHPMLAMLDEHWRLRADADWFGRPGEQRGGVTDYVAMSGDALVPWGFEPGIQDFHNPHAAHDTLWTPAEVVDAVARAGLRIRSLREYPYANGTPLRPAMRREGRRFASPAGEAVIPLMYSLEAER